jgi:hypothetical protein
MDRSPHLHLGRRAAGTVQLARRALPRSTGYSGVRPMASILPGTPETVAPLECLMHSTVCDIQVMHLRALKKRAGTPPGCYIQQKIKKKKEK